MYCHFWVCMNIFDIWFPWVPVLNFSFLKDWTIRGNTNIGHALLKINHVFLARAPSFDSSLKTLSRRRDAMARCGGATGGGVGALYISTILIRCCVARAVWRRHCGVWDSGVPVGRADASRCRVASVWRHLGRREGNRGFACHSLCN